jgi:hypothetical protein
MMQKTLFDSYLKFEIAQNLIQNGADVNEQDDDGRTPLFHMINTPLIKLLIENGADVNAKDNYNCTPLDYYIYEDAIKLLINHNAIGNIKTYKVCREYFNKEQQEIFDMFLSIVTNDEDFFVMCLSYQDDKKNNVKIDIKDMEIL